MAGYDVGIEILILQSVKSNVHIFVILLSWNYVQDVELYWSWIIVIECATYEVLLVGYLNCSACVMKNLNIILTKSEKIIK